MLAITKSTPYSFHRFKQQGVFPMSTIRGALQKCLGLFLNYKKSLE